MHAVLQKSKLPVDDILVTIADYVCNAPPPSQEAWETARLCLADTLGCALLSLQYHACTKLLGPLVPGTVVPHGCCIPGTSYILDPVRGAFNLGTMLRWLDFNDTWLAAEWGHPSDNIGGILTLMDYLGRKHRSEGRPVFTCRDLLAAIICAHEIQGVLALSNSFNRMGLDHVILVKVATAAVATKLLGGHHGQIVDALSQAWIDSAPLRTYRHAPNTGSRKSWAAGDATSRGVQLAWMVMQGEMGYPTALNAERWGFCDVFCAGMPIKLERPLGSYVMENILFKVSFPAEFHAQTAVEAAFQLHAMIEPRLDEIASIEIYTHESALRIIDKQGPLKNPADRDHCLQYMVAVALLYGFLNADLYEERSAADPRIDFLREKMRIIEDKQYSIDYLDPKKRSIANAIIIYFLDGSNTERISVEYPLGHRRRRQEALPALMRKFENNLGTALTEGSTRQIMSLFLDQEHLENMLVPSLVDLFCDEGHRL